MNVKLLFFFTVSFLGLAITADSQYLAQDDNGRVIVKYPDGSWRYYEPSDSIYSFKPKEELSRKELRALERQRKREEAERQKQLAESDKQSKKDRNKEKKRKKDLQAEIEADLAKYREEQATQNNSDPAQPPVEKVEVKTIENTVITTPPTNDPEPTISNTDIPEENTEEVIKETPQEVMDDPPYLENQNLDQESAKERRQREKEEERLRKAQEKMAKEQAKATKKLQDSLDKVARDYAKAQENLEKELARQQKKQQDSIARAARDFVNAQDKMLKKRQKEENKLIKRENKLRGELVELDMKLEQEKANTVEVITVADVSKADKQNRKIEKYLLKKQDLELELAQMDAQRALLDQMYGSLDGTTISQRLTPVELPPPPPPKTVTNFIEPNDVIINPPSIECNLVVDQKDPGTNKNRRQVASEAISSYTPDNLKPYYKDEDQMEIYAYASSISGGYKYVNLEVRVYSKTAMKDFNNFAAGKPLSVMDLEQEVHNFPQSYIGQPQKMTDREGYIFTANFQMDNKSMKKFDDVYLDRMRIYWNTGFEEYEIYNVDILERQIHCLNQ